MGDVGEQEYSMLSFLTLDACGMKEKRCCSNDKEVSKRYNFASTGRK
jgi:hypothetical protein